jgi:hypothetical protein
VGIPFQYVQGFSTTGGGGYEFYNGIYTSGAASPTLVNPDLTWSESNIKDIGLDLGFFRGKLNFEFDVYQRDRTGLLSKRDVTLPNTFGAELPQENLNSDRVRGLDMAMDHNNTFGDIKYSVGINLNYARTMNIHVESSPFQSSFDKWRYDRSDRWSDIVWAYELLGQFDDHEEILYSPIQNSNEGNIKELPGDYKYRDVNGDGLIDGNDMMPIFWGGEPKLHYGLTLSASWKGFDVFALFQGSGKFSTRYWGAGSYGEMFCYGGNLPAYFYDRWHPIDPYDPNSAWTEGTWPATRTKDNVGMLYAESAAWRYSASYLRCKTLDFGYTVSPNLIRNIGLSSLRVYINMHNLFTICDPHAKIFDPERIDGVKNEYGQQHGNIGMSYPLMKSYNLGLNITF